jgi:hypothetical protein
MFNNLEKYLQEIGYYLAVKDDAQEILTEIRSHILEKTEAEFSAVNEDTLGKTISGYGKPQQVAAKYLEGIEIISPIFKRHLFIYTRILFAFHFTFILMAFLFHLDMVVFPFLYIPKMDSWQIIIYFSMAYIYDLGLVTLFLYYVTQKKKVFRLSLPNLFVKEMKKPKIAVLTFLIILLGLLLFTQYQVGTIFFASLDNPGNPAPLFGPDASLYYSSLFLGMLGCEIIGYAARFINRSRWTDLIKNSVILFLLQFVWNSPMKTDFAVIPGVDLKTGATVFVSIITGVAIFNFLKSLISVNARQSIQKHKNILR